MTIYSAEKALSLPKILESLDSVDLKTPVLMEIRNSEDNEQQLRTFGMVVWFLNQCLLESNIKFLRVKGIPDMKLQQKKLILDSQAIEHLELVEGRSSLLNFIDNCSTHFGKRMLKQWLLAPLTNVAKIQRRLDCVEELLHKQS